MKEIRALTALRGVAAMAVVMQHFSATAQRHAAHPIPSLVPHGYMAVDLFFVLSGFIMAHTYAPDFALRGVAAMPDFLRKRVARIVPLNTFAVLLVVCAGAVSTPLLGRNIFYDSHHLAWDTLCNLAMLQGLGIGANLNAPSWSISTEFAAYFLFPALAAVTLQRSRAVAICGIVLCATVLTMEALSHPRLGLDTQTIGGGLVRCVTEFTIGLGVYRMLRDPVWSARLGRPFLAPCAIAWVLAMLVLRLDLLAAAGFPFLIATLAVDTGGTARRIASPVPYFLGEISFSLYLLHNLFRPVALALAQAWHPAPLDTAEGMAMAFLASATVIPFAWLAYIAVERPGRRFMRKLSRPAPVGTPAPLDTA